MSLSATVRALVLAGATPEMILAVVEVHEATTADALARRRSSDAARQQAQRDKKNNVKSRDVTQTVNGHADSSPHVGERAQVVTPFSSSLRSEEVGVGGGERERERFPDPEDWPPGKASDHARLIVETVASPWLDPDKSPDLVTTAGRFVAWRRQGASWEHDVLAVISGLCAKRRSRVSSWKYFDEAIARSIADNRAALVIPIAGSVRATGPPSLIDKITAERAEARRIALNDG